MLLPMKDRLESWSYSRAEAISMSTPLGLRGARSLSVFVLILAVVPLVYKFCERLWLSVLLETRVARRKYDSSFSEKQLRMLVRHYIGLISDFPTGWVLHRKTYLSCRKTLRKSALNSMLKYEATALIKRDGFFEGASRTSSSTSFDSR